MFVWARVITEEARERTVAFGIGAVDIDRGPPGAGNFFEQMPVSAGRECDPNLLVATAGEPKDIDFAQR